MTNTNIERYGYIYIIYIYIYWSPNWHRNGGERALVQPCCINMADGWATLSYCTIPIGRLAYTPPPNCRLRFWCRKSNLLHPLNYNTLHDVPKAKMFKPAESFNNKLTCYVVNYLRQLPFSEDQGTLWTRAVTHPKFEPCSWWLCPLVFELIIISYHIISYHIISYNIISYHHILIYIYIYILYQYVLYWCTS